MKTPTVGDHIRRNTRVLLISWFVGQVIQTIRLPIFIAYLGTEGIALWHLAFLVMGYIAFYNIGFDSAYLKYTAEYHARKDYVGLSQLLSTGVTLGFFIGAAIFAVIFYFSDAIAESMMNADTTRQQVADFRYLVLMVAAVNWYKMVMGVNRAMLSGVQRLDIGSWIGVVMSPLELASMLTALHLGYGVKTLVTIFAVFNATNHILMMHWNRKFLPGVRLNPFRARRKYLRPLFSLGGRMQAVGLIAIFVNTIDMLIYNKFYGLDFTGSYATAQRTCERAASVARLSLGSLTSASADLHGRRQFDKMGEIYASATRVSLLISVFVFAFAFANADLITRVFMNDHYTEVAVATLQLFCVAKVLHTITSTGSSMLRGGGQAIQEFAYLLLTAVIFLGLFVLTQIGRVYLTAGWTLPAYSLEARIAEIATPVHLDPHIWTILLAFPVALALASLIFVIMSNAYFRVPLACPFDWTLLPAAALVAAAFAIRALWDLLPGALFEAVLPFKWDQAFAPTLLSVLLLGGSFAMAFCAITIYMPGLSRKEKEQLLRFLPFGQAVALRVLPAHKAKA